MRLAATLSILIFLAPVSGAETIKLRSGEEIPGKVLSIDAASVTLENAPALERAAVSEIQFAAEAAKATAKTKAAEPSPEQKKAAADAFALANETAAKYPGMNGIVLLDHGEYVLKPDGTYTYRNHQVRQILKESLKQAWGQIIVCAEEGRERVKILKADVYSPDGSVTALNASLIKISKPQSGGGDFFVSGHICTQYGMPNVQVGSIVDYETESETYNPFRKDFFFPGWGFQDSEGPVRVSEVSVTVPDGTEFHYAVRNFQDPKTAEPAVSRSADAVTYYWKLENVPPIVGEPAMPSYEDVAPFMRGAVFKDWDRIFDWAGAMHKERTKASPELEKFTLDLIKDAKTEEEKAAKIYHYVQKEIRYIAVKVGVASGWGGYDANLTWKRRYGCCIDKALLLTAMFNVAGIKSSPVFINTNNMQEIDFRIPQVYFDHAITLAEVAGKKTFLDSTGYDYRFPQIASFDYGVKVLNIFGKTIEEVPVPEPKENGSFYDYKLEVSPGGAVTVAETMRYSGSREGGLRGYYRSIKKEEQKRAFQSFAKSVAPSAQLVSYEVNNAENIEEPFTLALKYSIADYPQKAGNIRIFKLPDFEIAAGRIGEISQDRRVYPIEYDASMGRYYSYEITVPANYEAVSLPEKISLSSPYASYSAGCRTAKKGRVLCEASWERPKRIIAAADYAAYKEFIEKAASYSKKQLFFKDTAAK